MAVIALFNCLEDETPPADLDGLRGNIPMAEQETLAAHLQLLLSATEIDELILFHSDSTRLDALEAKAPQITLCPLRTPLYDTLDSIYQETTRLVRKKNWQPYSQRLLYIRLSIDKIPRVRHESLVEFMQYFEKEQLQYLCTEAVSEQSDKASAKFEFTWLTLLDEAWQEALLPDDRQFVTPYISRQEQRLRVATIQA